MSSPAAAPESVRDPLADHLLTPQNCAAVVIDYHPRQLGTVTSIDHVPAMVDLVPTSRQLAHR